MFIACTLGLSQFATGVDRERFKGAVAAFAKLLDGSLFRRSAAKPKRRARRKRTPA